MVFKISYIFLIIGILIALYFLIRALRRIVKGIISYRKLGKEEFLKRLDAGFQSISPAQRTKGEIVGTVVSLIGMIVGIVVFSIIRVPNVWYWALISLGGGAIVTAFQLLGKVQNYKAQKKQDDILKELENK